MYKLEGKLKAKSETKQVSEKFKVMDIILVTLDEKYPQEIKLQVANDKINQFDFIAIDEPIEVTFDLRGREFKGNHYNTINVLNCESKLF